MACINMFSPDGHQAFSPPPPMSPRISFSNDFAVEQPPPAKPLLRCPGDPDFEFSVGSHPMMAADQLFSKGRVLPLKEAYVCVPHAQRPTTLRDELLAHDDDGDEKPRSIRWKELLGLRKAPHHCAGSKNGDRGGRAAAECAAATGMTLGMSPQEL